MKVNLLKHLLTRLDAPLAIVFTVISLSPSITVSLAAKMTKTMKSSVSAKCVLPSVTRVMRSSLAIMGNLLRLFVIVAKAISTKLVRAQMRRKMML